jgi:hypothetical protein
LRRFFLHWPALLIAASLFSLIAASARAQDSHEEDYAPISAPTNLQVLPKTISTYNLVSVMKQYRTQLGVKCSYCHAENPATHKLDFASDAKVEKKFSRTMITMTNDLIAKYLANPPTGHTAVVNCGTCHRGKAVPEMYIPPVDQYGSH